MESGPFNYIRLRDKTTQQVYSITQLADRSVLVETSNCYELYNPFTLRITKRFSESLQIGNLIIGDHFIKGRVQFRTGTQPRAVGVWD